MQNYFQEMRLLIFDGFKILIFYLRVEKLHSFDQISYAFFKTTLSFMLSLNFFGVKKVKITFLQKKIVKFTFLPRRLIYPFFQVKLASGCISLNFALLQ